MGFFPHTGKGAADSAPFRQLSYLSHSMTVEISTRTTPTVAMNRNRTRNFLPHCASISTEIGECCDVLIAFPP